MNSTYHYEQLIGIFNSYFAGEFNIRLIKGDDEPIYLPAGTEVSYNRIVFAYGFYTSAIHGTSHRRITGKARRKLVDFSYWYCSDGRGAQTQSQSEDVEVKPRALDWLFCVAAGYPFNVSCDNLEGDFEPDCMVFQRRVYTQVMDYLANGIPERPARFIKVLQNYYHTPGLTAGQSPRSEVFDRSQRRVLQRGKKMITEFESRTLVLIDGMVDHASDDELFASGYLRSHLILAIAELESGDNHPAQAVHTTVSQSLGKAIDTDELSLRDQALATDMWEYLFQQTSQ